MQLEIPFAEDEVYPVQPRTGVMVPMNWILRNVTYSNDTGSLSTPYGWLRLMAEKSDDNLARLIPAMEVEGQLDPTVLFDEGDHHSIGNGHHRLVLNILRGADWHRVLFRDGTDIWGDGGWFESTENDGRQDEYTPDHKLADMLYRSLREGARQAYPGENSNDDEDRCDCEECIADVA